MPVDSILAPPRVLKGLGSLLRFCCLKTGVSFNCFEANLCAFNSLGFILVAEANKVTSIMTD